MSELGTYIWTGASGREYVYTRYRTNTRWDAGSANYICAKMGNSLYGDSFDPKYIGETENLKKRLPNHEKWPCCNRNGVNEIHINREAKSLEERQKQEADLVERYAPLCNR